ncbi:MAG: hypothetical protein WBO55_06615 [Rhizobiaceae bacterium]
MMRNFSFKSHARGFSADKRGGATLQAALLFGAIGLGMAVLAAPLLQGAVDFYAENKALGIDRVITGAVGSEPNRYTIRKSVLSDKPQKICTGKDSGDC